MGVMMGGEAVSSSFRCGDAFVSGDMLRRAAQNYRICVACCHAAFLTGLIPRTAVCRWIDCKGPAFIANPSLASGLAHHPDRVRLSGINRFCRRFNFSRALVASAARERGQGETEKRCASREND
jgi:hypothetical protein